MQKKTTPNFFKKNGKHLTSLYSRTKKLSSLLFQNEIEPELLTTLQDDVIQSVTTLIIQEENKESVFSLYDKPNYIAQIKTKVHNINNPFASMDFNFKKIWLAVSVPAFALAALVFVFYPSKILPNVHNKYSIYASTPLVLGAADYQIYSKDARAQRINEVFKEYNCPLEGFGEIFVYQADKHHIPWWIVPAISFQESSCGKMTPEKKGVESYNAWGWAVYGDNVQMFDNWVHGIETVSTYLSDRFFSKGITEPCDIMKTYTPPSKGSWCEGVNYFKDIIVNYQTPNN